jgi:hypothetical protein
MSRIGYKCVAQALLESACQIRIGKGSEDAMPIKPNGALCKVREQIVEDEASGLILQFECENGCMRLIIAGASLPFGNREILFDDEGREAAAGTMLGRFRRPSWLTKVK